MSSSSAIRALRDRSRGKAAALYEWEGAWSCGGVTLSGRGFVWGTVCEWEGAGLKGGAGGDWGGVWGFRGGFWGLGRILGRI